MSVHGDEQGTTPDMPEETAGTERNLLDEEPFRIPIPEDLLGSIPSDRSLSSTTLSAPTPRSSLRPPSSGPESSDESPARPASPSPQVSPTGSQHRATPCKHPPYGDRIWDKIVQGDSLVHDHHFEEAYNVYQEALLLSPEDGRLHHRLCLLYIRLGLVGQAEIHISQASPDCHGDLNEKIEKVKGHMVIGENSRLGENWMAALNEIDAVIAEGADSSKSIHAFRAEMLLRLDRLDQAQETISQALQLQDSAGALVLESRLPNLNKFLGMQPEAYVYAVHAQIEMALGRFESAVAAADRAYMRDKSNNEVSTVKTNILLARAARIKGNEYFLLKEYSKAIHAYNQGLEYARSNASLLSNLEACQWQLEKRKRCIQICTEVLQIRPDNTEALLQRANSYVKLGKWAECVKDYEEALRIFPRVRKVAEAFLHALVSLRKSQVEYVSEIKEITTPQGFKDAISVGNSIVFFHEATSRQCIDINPYFDALCYYYPMFNFIKVDTCVCCSVADAQNIFVTPSFVQFQSGNRVKDIGSPTSLELVYWIRDIASRIE